MKKKISVIIPYYKNLEYIFHSVNSAIRQKYNNKEIIIIYDDKDKTDLFKLKKKYKKNKKIRFIINKKNLGVALSRNKGMLGSKGYYIAFLDSDDYWKNNKIIKQINFMKKNSLDLSYTAYDILKNNKKIKHQVQKSYSYDDLIKKCDIGLSTVIMKSKMIKTASFPNLKTQEDYALWLKYLRNGAKIMGINESLTVWRDKPNSLSKNVFQKLSDSFIVYYKFENKNFLESVFSVLILSINKIKKNLKFNKI